LKLQKAKTAKGKFQRMESGLSGLTAAGSATKKHLLFQIAAWL